MGDVVLVSSSTTHLFLGIAVGEGVVGCGCWESDFVVGAVDIDFEECVELGIVGDGEDIVVVGDVGIDIVED